MIGWINLSVERFIVKTFGEDAWNKVVSESGVECAWVSSCPYPDKVTYDLVITAAGILGVTVNQALEAYGVYFVDYVTEQGYTKLLKVLGSDIVEFLANLNNLHLHLNTFQPAMDAPAFRVENVTVTSCHLHYYSRRPALWPIVVGVLKGLSKEYLKFDLVVTLLEGRDAGTSDHEVFLVEYPEQDCLRGAGAHAAVTAGGGAPGPMGRGTDQSAGFAMSAESFAELHPFHILLDKQCCVLQFGSALRKLVPGIALGRNIADMLSLRHPHTGLTWDGIVRETANSYVLQVPSTGLELKGQMVPSSMPVPGCPVPKPVLLFLGSPRCANLDDMLKFGLFLSDIPLHDLSRDFVLLAEQRQAEADLKEKFEKLTLDLKAEMARSEALVQRMSGLLACFPFKGGKAEAKKQPSVNPDTPQGGEIISAAIDEADDAFGRMEVIEAVRRTLNHMNMKQSEDDQIEIIKAIGEGTYGRVYRGLWQGTEVAIKTIILPAGMSGTQKREKMAVMEAAISSSLSHPNIVQTYTYTIRPLRDSAVIKAGHLNQDGASTDPGSGGMTMTMDGGTMGGTAGSAKSRQGAVHSYEVRLVLELCDKGSLRDALEQKAFVMLAPPPEEGGQGQDRLSGGPRAPVGLGAGGQQGAGTGPGGQQLVLNYAAILDTALDVAKACIHLHRNNVLHTDLKARNVLLRGGGGQGRGLTAKVGDFGLAVKLPEDGSHLSHTYQGTLTHMAPETLMDGQVSKASDVYAFGIVLWELYTGDHAFKGVPKTLLGHQVTIEHRRPEFPPGTPAKYKQLAAWCWNKDIRVRPTFEEVLSSLVSLRRELGGVTPPLGPIRPSFASSDGTADPMGGTAAQTLQTQGDTRHTYPAVHEPEAAQGASMANTLTSRLPLLPPHVALVAEDSLSYEPSSSEGSYRDSDSS